MKQESCYQDDRFNRFWTIEVVDRTCITTHGRIGSEPRETRRKIPTTYAAQRELEKPLVRSSRRGVSKGPSMRCPSTSSRVAPQ